MGYSAKWMRDNLGVTRDMIRYYEKEELIPIRSSRNPANNYRDYSDEDIERIWCIKLLIGIGFSVKEIKQLMTDPSYDFDTAIARKVVELEKKHDEALIYLEFAKSIKITGRVPTVTQLGSMTFDAFLTYAREHWNFFDDPRSAPFMKAADLLIDKPAREWSPDDVERIYNLAESFDTESMMKTYALHGYYQVLSDMREMDFRSETVQRVVRLLHEYLVSSNTEPELDGKITPELVARYTAPSFICGDTSILYERIYGNEGCRFIAQALAFYGGYTIDEL